jgi:predicted metalloprotease with PDZ domain
VGAAGRDGRREGAQTNESLKLGICGEHGGDPSSVHFCHKAYVGSTTSAARPSACRSPASRRRRRREGAKHNEATIAATLALPDGWSAATVLRTNSGDGPEPEGVIRYDPVTLEVFVDSPIMVGRYARAYELANGHEREGVPQTPPTTMHVFSEAESVVKLPGDVVEAFEAMVEQATVLFGAHHFDRFDILVATSDRLRWNGLEHTASTFNIISQRALQDLDDLRGWQQMLIPHEYVHAWCGKYRRPAGMATDDFHTPKDTRLLWVYEGLTQYYGTVLEARSGMLTVEEMRDWLRRTVSWRRARQGREWRPLDDTASASWTLRGAGGAWSGLRLGQDYYSEGALVWLEADALIRDGTEGEKSLDDFARVFFAHAEGDPVPKPFTRKEVIETLSGVHAHDWDAFFSERIERPLDRPVLELVPLLGYRIEFAAEPPETPRGVSIDALDAYDSIGARFSSNGTVRDVLLGSPADDAGLAPNMRIAGVNGHVWSSSRFADALALTPVRGDMELLVISGDTYVTRTVAYDGGRRHMRIVRDETKDDHLAAIAEAK